MKKLAAIAAILAVSAAGALAADQVDPAVVERVYADMFKSAKDEWAKRVVLDETQKLCSEKRNNLSTAEFNAVQAREKATIKMPADGKVMGLWKSGEKIAQSGFGLRFNDKPGTINGGNCYACHQLSKTELSFGTLGPSLVEYGKIRKYNLKEAQRTFAQIYNPQGVQPCSNMPRFGHNGVLSEQQIKDLVALLFDPESPVNK
jgi:sulfur-oxidizing protein SoxX